MTEVGPLYTRIEDVLPAVYRRDAESWRQILAYFGPLNSLQREFVLALQELPTWLSPAAPEITPPGGLHASRSERLQRQNEVLDEIASWFDFDFGPAGVWHMPDPLYGASGIVEELVKDKANALRALPRLMRSRATPTGFLELFCSAFRLDPKKADQCPILIEHFAFRPASVGRRNGTGTDRSDAGDSASASITCPKGESAGKSITCPESTEVFEDDALAWGVTMLLPPTACPTWHQWREVKTWVERNAPAHLSIGLERVADSFWGAPLNELLQSAVGIEEMLAEVRTHVVEDEALRTSGDGDDRDQDRLDFGRVPGSETGD